MIEFAVCCSFIIKRIIEMRRNEKGTRSKSIRLSDSPLLSLVPENAQADCQRVKDIFVSDYHDAYDAIHGLVQKSFDVSHRPTILHSPRTVERLLKAASTFEQ